MVGSLEVFDLLSFLDLASQGLRRSISIAELIDPEPCSSRQFLDLNNLFNPVESCVIYIIEVVFSTIPE